jgi:hypothetical protein
MRELLIRESGVSMNEERPKDVIAGSGRQGESKDINPKRRRELLKNLTQEAIETGYSNTDELLAAIRRDELNDAEKLTPKDFAELVGTTAQLVYYWIKAGHIKTERCACGRRVVDVKEGLAYNAKRLAKRSGRI